MTVMSEPGENTSRKAVRLELRRVKRRVPGLGVAVFRAPSVGDEIRLAPFYDAEAPNHRDFVNETVATTLESPVVDTADVDAWTERARAIARVAVAEAAGCTRDYRRHAGSGFSGDERLYRAMRARHERQLEHLQQTMAGVSENVVRLVEATHKAVRQSGVLESIARNQRHVQRIAHAYTRAFRPAYIEQIELINRRFEQIVRPSLVGQLGRRIGAVDSFARGYARMAEDFSRRFDAVVRPSYFGALERMSRQINEALRPRYFESVSRLIEQMQQAVRPSYLDQIGAIARRFQELMGAPLFEVLRESLERYGGWLERNWAQVYANPDHPPPVIFVLASLPMAIGLRLLRVVEKDDEPLLELLEAAMDGTTPVIDGVQTAVQQDAQLDAIAKRHLVTALEHLRSRQYVDAEPPLYQGLERAFKLVACQRGIVDRHNRFLVEARTAKARSVDDLFEHLALDTRYLRFLRSWVFGPWGHLARHGDLPESEHRRWVLRAFVALLGWLEYCGGDERPMEALVARLELEARQDEQTA
jgi:hypothetical protein